METCGLVLCDITNGNLKVQCDKCIETDLLFSSLQQFSVHLNKHFKFIEQNCLPLELLEPPIINSVNIADGSFIPNYKQNKYQPKVIIPPIIFEDDKSIIADQVEPSLFLKIEKIEQGEQIFDEDILFNDNCDFNGDNNDNDNDDNVSNEDAGDEKLGKQSLESDAEENTNGSIDKTKTPKPSSIRNCTECGETFKTFASLKEHQNTKHLTCRMCNKSFKKRKGLLNHMSVIHNDHLVCQTCGLTFNKKKLESHYPCHYQEKLFVCSQCDMKFHSKDGIRDHIRKVHTERKFNCSDCDLKFKLRHQLKKHYNRCHSNLKPEKKYICLVCSKGFANNCDLVEHERSRHTGDKPLQCPVCEECFARKATYRNHRKKLHPECTNLKPIMKFHLKEGIRDYTGNIHTERKFGCSDCDSKFKIKHQLKKHYERCHSNLKLEKNYICLVCSKGFANNCELVEHERTRHTGEKPLQCPVCKECFARQATYRNHTKKFHPECTKLKAIKINSTGS